MCLQKWGYIQQGHWFRCKLIAICLEQNQALAAALQLPSQEHTWNLGAPDQQTHAPAPEATENWIQTRIVNGLLRAQLLKYNPGTHMCYCTLPCTTTTTHQTAPFFCPSQQIQQFH